MNTKGCHLYPDVPVAIIGMGCFFPKSSGLKEYWRLIFRGEDAVTEVPNSHWAVEDYFHADPKKPDHVYCSRGGFLESISFDPSEYGIPPTNLEATDSSQLLGLLAAKMALKDAGYDNDREFNREKTGVILGVTGTQELVIPLGARLGHPIWKKALADSGVDENTAGQVVERISDAYVPWQENSFPGLLGNVVAGRICNRLNLKGTNCVVDAACASSLSAVNLALLELAAGRSDMMVTGGVDTLNDIFMHMCFSSTGILSPTGDIKPFSKDADGTVLGEGIGMLVLKRLEDAEKDEDRIYAVIKGIGTSSDGKSQSIYAPRAEGQEQAIRAAWERSGLPPETVELIEAHGTGTRVGDQVEFSALNQYFGKAFGSNGDSKGAKCAIGSVKSMIGHSKAAAGSAGLIKAVLSLHNKILPPTLKADEADPKLGIDNSPFYINTKTRPWFTKNGHPRRCGVSSFGFGGSNYHVVLEEHKSEKKDIAWDGTTDIIALSAASKDELLQKINDFSNTVAKKGISEGEKAVFCAQTRSDFLHDADFRLLMIRENSVKNSRNGNINEILNRAEKAIETNDTFFNNKKDIFFGTGQKPGPMAFVFPGQGSQYVNMGRDVVCCFPQAFRSMEKAELQFSGRKQPLWKYIYPAQIRSQAEQDSLEKSLRNTDIAQPAIGAVTLADIKILNMFGLFPDAACGHSFGELTALYAGGYIDEETFLQLSVARGKFMALAGKTNSDKTENNNRADDDYDANGAMLAVKAPLNALENIAGRIGQDIVLANRNSPEQGVLSGSTEAIERANKLCQSEGYRTILLPVSAAFHSHLVEDAAIPFGSLLKTIDIKPGTIPVFSNTTADPYPDDPDLTRKILGRQLAMPVNFCGQIQNMYDAGIRTFVEVGPKGILSGLITSILNDRTDVHIIALDPGAGKKSGTSDLARVLCHLGSLGYGSKLSLWEYPLKAVEKQRMQIPVSGANYRSVSDKKTKRFDNKTKSSDTKTRDFDNKAKTPVTRKRLDQSEPPLAQAKSTIVKTVKAPVQTPAHQGSKPIEPGFMEYKSSNMKTNVVTDALKAVQEGLKSMQAIQQQTADSHNHFLDTQKEASRTLQKMMESTGRLAEISMGFADLLQPGHQEVETFTVSRQQAQSENIQPGNMQPEPESVIKPIAPEASRIVQQPEPIDNGKNDKAKIAEMAIQVVSDLTGYPVDMISQDMDIESDLGIDSIKRVEILSTLEERMPGLPQVSPDVMGSLKTLGQVVDYLMEESLYDGQAPEQTAQERGSEASSSGQPAFDLAGSNTSNQKIGNTLLNVVGRLTGYPVDMLSLDMDIEADLGIDSIKRVEILSSLEEEMAGLPSVSPEDMGRLKTLGQIVEYLSDTKPANTSLAQAQITSKSDVAFAPTVENSKQVSSSPNASLDSEHIAKSLLQVVANLTGYPMDMLSLDMDIEADLGIDSIKRVEILSSLEEEIPDLPGVSPEDMGRLKTLGQIVEYLFESFGGSEKTETPKKKKTKNITIPETGSLQISPVMAEPAGRQEVRVIENPFKPGPEISLPAGTRIYLTDDEGAGIGEAVKNELAALGVEAEIISRDFCSSKNAKIPHAAGLVIIHPSSRNRPVEQAGYQDSYGTQIDDTAFLKQAFSLAKTFGPDLNEAGRKSGAVFATITQMDGKFGFSKTPVQNPVQGGLAGLAKTAAIEWPQVKCHAFDIDPACDNDQAYVKQIAKAVADDLIHKGGPVEIGLSGDKRYAVTLEPSQYKEGETDILKPGDLVVVTGGARGITASTCLALAHHSRPNFALLGRSPVPEAMPEWFEGLESEAEIKKAILQNEYSEEKIKPAQLESAYRKHMANLEILNTLTGLRASGVKAEYYSVDIRDQKKTADVIDTARNLFGPVKALIHGAGVLKDRLIIEKSSEHFDMVFDTKVTGLFNLLASTADDPLKYMVFFSSVSARMGNQGQVDYSMANEVLNKIAQQEALRKPGTRVKSINWGPWDGGMVSSALKKEFEKNNVELIKIDRGAANLICEMKEKNTDSVEVVIGDGLPGGNMMGENSLNSIYEPETPLCLTFKREIDLKMLPILGAHVLDGYPVVPFALMTEWLGHGALHENPGLFLHGLDDIRLLKGIQINNGTKHVRLLAGKPIKNGQIYEVYVELRDEMKEGRELIHSRAKAILTDVLEKPPAVNIPEYMNNGGYSRPMNEVYEKILFHGIGLHGIEEIKHCSARGMIAKISSAPAPEQWMVNPIRSKWIADPLVLDSAFQMAIVWCYEQLGTLCLPSYSASYRQYCRHFPKQGVTVLMEVNESGRYKMKSDFTFMDDEQNVVACLKGHEAIMDESLFEAFEKCKVL